MSPLVVVAVLLAQTGPAPAWQAVRGTWTEGRTPGSFVLTTEAVPGRFSSGEVLASAPVPIPYRLDVTWRRLGPEAGRSLHLLVEGGIVLLRANAIGLWAFDEAGFAERGWSAIDYDPHREHTVGVEQDARAVRVFVDGVLVKRFEHVITRAEARPGIGLKGAPGHRTRVWVRRLARTPLGRR